LRNGWAIISKEKDDGSEKKKKTGYRMCGKAIH